MALYKRLTEQGTLSEPDGVPDPVYALPGTVNWMRALALLVESAGLSSSTAKAVSAGVARPNPSLTDQEANSVFDELLLALHQGSALSAMAHFERPVDVMRVGIVSWYYGIYAASSAMVTARTRATQDDHTSTANIFSQEIAARGLISSPFDFRISSLVRNDAEAEIAAMKGRVGTFKMAEQVPKSPEEAEAAHVAYLSGSVGWWTWRAQERVKQTRAFRDLGVDNFRSKAAREVRDSVLRRRSISFLHMAFRYRGKANYRDALFLGYGPEPEKVAGQFVSDLDIVLRAFLSCAGQFCARRLGRDLWNEFLEDLEEKRAFTLSPSEVWE